MSIPKKLNEEIICFEDLSPKLSNALAEMDVEEFQLFAGSGSDLYVGFPSHGLMSTALKTLKENGITASTFIAQSGSSMNDLRYAIDIPFALIGLRIATKTRRNHGDENREIALLTSLFSEMSEYSALSSFDECYMLAQKFVDKYGVNKIKYGEEVDFEELAESFFRAYVSCKVFDENFNEVINLKFQI